MKTHSEESLTWSTVSSFGGRKEPGRVSVLVDTVDETVYLVPRDMEHIDFAQNVLQRAPESMHSLVPSHIDIDEALEQIKILTGVCGLEILLRVRHSPDELDRAHERTKEYVARGEIPYPIVDDRIVLDYCSATRAK